MTTQRIRDAAQALFDALGWRGPGHRDEEGEFWSSDVDKAAGKLQSALAESSQQTHDVPVVTHWYRFINAFEQSVWCGSLSQLDGAPVLETKALVAQADHLSAIAALQDRIKSAWEANNRATTDLRAEVDALRQKTTDAEIALRKEARYADLRALVAAAETWRRELAVELEKAEARALAAESDAARYRLGA